MLKKLNNKFIVTTFIVLFTLGLNSLLRFIFSPLLTRILSQSDFGLFNLFNNYYNFFVIFFTFALTRSIYNRGLIEFSDKRIIFFYTTISSSWFFTIFFALISVIVINLFSIDLGYSFLLLVLLLLMFFSTPIFESFINESKFFLSYKNLFIFLSLHAILTNSTPILLFIFFSVTDLEILIISSNIWLPILSFIIFISKLSSFKFRVDLKMAKFIILFNLPLLLHYISFSIMANADRFLISHFNGNAFLGVYSLAYTISSLVLLFYSGINSVYSPYSLKELSKGNFEGLNNTTKIIFYIMFIVSLIIIFIIPEIYLFFPDEYQSAVLITPYIILGNVFFIMSGFVTNIFLYFSKNTIILFTSLTSAIINLLLNLIFLRVFGWSFAAYSTLITYFIYFTLNIVFYYKLKVDIINFSLLFRQSLLILLFSILITHFYFNFLIRFIMMILILIFLFLFYKKKILKEFNKVSLW